LGKIADSLGKCAQERKDSRFPELTQADLDVLLAFNRKTGHLLNFDSESGQMGNHSMEVLRNRGILQRLLDNKLIYPGGKLTPRGLEICELKQNAVPDQKPPVISGEHLGGKPAAQTRTADALARSQEDVPTVTQPAEPLPIKQPEKAEKSYPQEMVQPMQGLPLKPSQESLDKPVKAYETRSNVRAAKFNENAIDNNLISLTDPQSYESEQFKSLRTNLLFPVSGTPPKSILVTSSMPGDGKSFVSCNLAISIALNINKHVLLIDCDLRKPDVHRMFGFGEIPGLTEYLRDQRMLESILVRTGVDKLTLLPGGSVPPNPSELMSTERMSGMIEEVKHRYHDRLIVVDSPPPGLATETAFLARHVDGIIVVVKHAKTPRDEVEELMEKMGTEKILGVVINHLDLQTSGRYGYKKYGSYGKRYER